METYRIILNYENYLVSDMGNIKNKITGRILKPSLTFGYPRLALIDKKGVRRSHVVHRLVANAFISNKDNKREVNHINGIKTDNTVGNLEWCTPSENQRHSLDNGLRKIRYHFKLKESEILEIRENKNDLTYKKLSILYNVSQGNISDIINRKTWKSI